MDQEYQGMDSVKGNCGDPGICSDGMDLKIIYNLVDFGKDGADRYDGYRDHIPAGIAKALEQLGSKNLISGIFSFEGNRPSDTLYRENHQ